MHDGPSFLLMLLLSLMSTVPAADRLQSTPPRRGEVTAICIGTATVLARSSQVAAAAAVRAGAARRLVALARLFF